MLRNKVAFVARLVGVLESLPQVGVLKWDEKVGEFDEIDSAMQLESKHAW